MPLSDTAGVCNPLVMSCYIMYVLLNNCSEMNIKIAKTAQKHRKMLWHNVRKVLIHERKFTIKKHNTIGWHSGSHGACFLTAFW